MARFVDFVVHAHRENARLVAVMVYSSPAGLMAEPVHVVFPAAEAQSLHGSFLSTGKPGENGRLSITQQEATNLGKRLAQVLFPDPVFRLLARSLSQVTRRPRYGLRIRLALDASLVDLPWEYTYRPDRIDAEGVSGFLLLDPAISMVREPAHPRILLNPISGLQRLAFVGALWEGAFDGWNVKLEFKQLKKALQPVSKYISASFTVANADALGKNLNRGAAIFHYSGHCDFDQKDRAFLIHEVPETSLKTASVSSGPTPVSITGGFGNAPRTYIDELAPILTNSQVRLVVMTACNSGFWPAVKPLLQAGIPAIVAINGAASSESMGEFCSTLYESLAIGLTLDEAVDRGRLHVLAWGQKRGLFDWGLYMVYMPALQSTLFPRARTRTLAAQQLEVRREHRSTIASTFRLARELDGMHFVEIMSELTERRVLILGRFIDRRKKILVALKERLKEHPNHYIPELFDSESPEHRDWPEAVTGFAALSRFILADITEANSVPLELEKVVHNFPSVPIVPIIKRNSKPYPAFQHHARRPNVVNPPIQYRDLDDLLRKFDGEIICAAESKMNDLRPPA